ncbi:MAG: HAD-IC family P-type ATPase [Caldilineaceae bacterium]|nr:HAD-IC family P-type ATPase [Caldilineaceae bacterium]
MTELSGLTSQQVIERRQRGQGNNVALATSRTVKDIVMTNVFNPVNLVLYAIGIGLALVGDLASAFATLVLVLLNALVGIVQEVRAKRQLDQIALLARSQVTVRRAGAEQKVDPSELVQGDLLVIRAGDQIPVDGVVVSDGKLEVDESALTGESDLVNKSKEDQVLSGTFAISGEVVAEATGVGEGSFANKLTQNARKFSMEVTPLQRSVNLLLRIVLLIVAFFGVLAVIALFVLDLPLNVWLQILAVITGSVSAGLLTLITLNYSWGAVRIGQQGGLVQQINAIESLCNVTVLCTDKTGTLTANRINYHASYPVGLERAELEQLLADFAASASAVNKTSEAILKGLPGIARPVADEVPFNSARKWSALAFDDAGDAQRPPLKGVYVLGALEMLQEHFAADPVAVQQLQAWSNSGLRVLVFAGNATATTLHDAAGEPALPPLTLLGVVSFSDELRPHLQETIGAFTGHGVKLKVISGDNPQTVAALARQAGFPGDLRAVSGPELAQMSEAEFTQTAVDATVFGRITPQQKETLVDALRSRGEYVAMMGDGVNDVLSLKKANLGVAMESGSSATRSVAAIVLLGDSFEVMPQAFSEGQRIVNSIQEILKLFMATVFALLLLVIGITMLGIGFPFTTLQSTLLSIFARGAPPLILAFVATSLRQQNSLLQNMLHFTLPASLTIFFFGFLLYIGVFFVVGQRLVDASLSQHDLIALGANIGRDYSDLSPQQAHAVTQVAAAQTALTGFFVLAGVLLMVFAQPPMRWLAGGAPYNGGKWLPVVASAILIIVYGGLLTMPGMRRAFDLVPLPLDLNLMIVGVTLVWAATQLLIWRFQWMERFLGIETDAVLRF